jgi:Holliday junction resolvasome RuvABC DNA-binding subunit
MEKAGPLPLGQRAWSQEEVINALKGLGYSTREAGEMFSCVAPSLRAEYSLEYVVRLALQEFGKEG